MVASGRAGILVLVGFVTFCGWLFPARSARADVILVVDTASDVVASDGACSLREAITAANNNANYFGCLGNGGGFDLIEFSLGGGTPVIDIASALPSIIGPLEINGAPNRVELRGPGSGTGLRISGAGAAGSSVRNLVVNSFDTAIFAEMVSNVSIVGNNIGTNTAGSAPVANLTGILLSGGSAQIGDTNGWIFGGSCTGGCNLISGNIDWGISLINGSSATIQGNVIGTDASGTSPIGNGTGVETEEAIFTIGGTANGSGNLISGNANGISIQFRAIAAAGSVVQGNRVGTNSVGSAAIPNGTGVSVNLDNRTYPLTIGGSMAGAGNLISGNAGAGVFLIQADYVGIYGNLIGTQADGASPLPNGGTGVQLSSSTHDNIMGGLDPGQGNVIAYNATGVSIGVVDYYNKVRGNSIRDNAGKGIALADNQNNTVSTPTITGVAPLSGTTCPNCQVDIYSDLADEGDTYEGTVLANAAGHWSFNGTVSGPNVTTVATSLVGSSSEFSAPVPVPEPDGRLLLRAGVGLVVSLAHLRMPRRARLVERAGFKRSSVRE
jgi:CSLREA domain-containing protein